MPFELKGFLSYCVEKYYYDVGTFREICSKYKNQIPD